MPPKYETIREIGHGAYGTVHLAKGPDGFVALKTCIRPADGDAAPYEREKRGILAAMRIPAHAGLVRIFSFEEADDGHSFTYSMEIADNEETGRRIDPATYRPKTLSSILSAEVALPLRDCIRLGVTLSGALAHLQSHHLLHRDVKPGNVLYVHGKPVLADFGLAIDVREATSIVGTPGYEPPEHHGTAQGDIYSLGKTLYRAATGREADETGFLPCAEADVDAPFFWRYMTIVEKACSSVPARRYRSAKAMYRELILLKARSDYYRRWPLRVLASILVIAAFMLLSWSFFFFRVWLQEPDDIRYHFKAPWPYHYVEFLFVPSEDPGGPECQHKGKNACFKAIGSCYKGSGRP